jgi:hypothetical protein
LVLASSVDHPEVKSTPMALTLRFASRCTCFLIRVCTIGYYAALRSFFAEVLSLGGISFMQP